MRLIRTVLLSTFAVAVLPGCAGSTSGAVTAERVPTTAQSAAPSDASSAAGRALLAKHSFSGKSAVEIIDQLDRMAVSSRPTDLMASVRPRQLVVSGDDTGVSLPIPDDRFYLSVAPYVDTTHDCFNHSLTTCKGEMGGEDVQVNLVEEGAGSVLVGETKTVFDNGFVGLWLPKDITGTLRITHDGRTAESRISTHDDDPTCLTTMRLT
ncbi:CueP family metal-binding protein [Knoellia sp. CPCC 206450]|uniref:CueP family metal-binding protein n=1 Tax=Knoellia tibetensis TaxID=3404798 RepID=UPI003B42B26C